MKYLYLVYYNRNSICSYTFIYGHLTSCNSFLHSSSARYLRCCNPPCAVVACCKIQYTVLCVLLDGERLYICAEGFGLTVLASFCGCFKQSFSAKLTQAQKLYKYPSNSQPSRKNVSVRRRVSLL